MKTSAFLCAMIIFISGTATAQDQSLITAAKAILQSRILGPSPDVTPAGTSISGKPVIHTTFIENNSQ